MNNKPINLAAVRTARENLKRLRAEHPDAWGPTGDEIRMAATPLRQFRIKDELIERLDAYAAWLAKEKPAYRVNRSTALRAIVHEHLERWEAEHKPKRKGRRKK